MTQDKTADLEGGMTGEPQPAERPSSPEAERPLQPHIWVASLADYNAGRLYGDWLDAQQEPEELQTAIQQLLARSMTPGAEEWAIFDSDDFAGLRIDEHESLR